MEPIRKHYVEFLYSGPLVCETASYEVLNRNPKAIKIPDDAFAFRFFDIVFVEVETSSKKTELSIANTSPLHYYGGRIFTEKEVIAQIPNNKGLLRSMRNNSYKKIIRTRTGDFRPFNENEDIFIKE